jgi:glycerol uptake facilitator protein
MTLMFSRGPLLGEFMGMFILMLLGNGVNASVLLKKTKAEGSGWLVITIGWAFAVLCGIFTANLFGSPDAHLNPAITLAFAVKTGDFAKCLPYLVAQLGGAFVGATAVWLFYLPHWAMTEDQGAKLGVFATGPTVRLLGWNLFCEVLATFVLVIVVGSISSKLVLSTGAAAGLSPFLVGCLVWSIGLSLGATTGYAINPARDLGPRLAHSLLPIAGKGGSDWAYAWVPIAGPLIGAAAAGAVLRFLGA